jgi:hypothetical protein
VVRVGVQLQLAVLDEVVEHALHALPRQAKAPRRRCYGARLGREHARRDPRELDGTRGGEIPTAMTFDDFDAVAAFTGGNPSASVVPASARKVLARFDQHSQHYISLATFPGKLTG